MNLSIRGRGAGGDGALDQARERLVSQLKGTIDDTEELLHSVADSTGERVQLARERVQGRLRDARSALGEGETALRERYQQAARTTERYVATNPWRSVAVAMAAGVVIGLLLDRRR